MRNQWTTRVLSKDDPLLKLIGGEAGTYEIMFDIRAEVIRVRASGKKEGTIPLPKNYITSEILNKKINKPPDSPESESRWYPGSNSWKDEGLYQVKYAFNEKDECIEILIAKPGLNNRQADQEHFHVFRAGPDQGINFKDAQGRLKKLSPSNVEMIFRGARPLF